MKLVADSDISLLKRKYKLKALEVWKMWAYLHTDAHPQAKWYKGNEPCPLIALPFDQLQDMN